MWYQIDVNNIVAGMTLVINEASERHPPLPAGFPTCGSYDMGAAGYKHSVENADNPRHAAGTATLHVTH